MIKNLCVLVVSLLIALNFAYGKEIEFNEEKKEILPKQHQEKITGLKIVGFLEDSNLKKSGAKLNDIIVEYDNKKVVSLQNLKKLKEEAVKEEVEVLLVRDGEEIKIPIPKGQLGVYLKEIVPEHKVDDDAVVLEGYKPLEWGKGMENTYLGAVYIVNEKLNKEIPYSDLVGLSGYGFRLQFFDDWCPSSPDAFCGKNIGSIIMDKLGYECEVYGLNTMDFEEEPNIITKSKDELVDIIKDNIDMGYPVIATDLIEIPEWGVITGYQKDGKELFCRTYFDKTEGYEIAKKFPWVICVIKDKKKVELEPEFKNSLAIAKELYNTDKYGKYFSGIKATEEWINDLRNEEFFETISKEKLAEVMLANWWIYYSLMEARVYVKEYLDNNIERFHGDEAAIEKISNLYDQEIKILSKGFNYVPSAHISPLPNWTPEMRTKEIEVLKEFLEKEKQVKKILNEII